MCDPEFRAALARHGYTLDPATGEVAELAPYVGRVQRPDRADPAATSTGTKPSGAPTTRTRSPARRLRQAWDRRAWAHGPTRQGRPPRRRRAGRTVGRGAARARVPPPSLGQASTRGDVATPGSGRLDRDAVVETVLTRLGSKRSAWNAADIRGEVEQQIAAAGVVADPAVRRELAEDLTARAVEACVPLLARTDVPEHVRVPHLTTGPRGRGRPHHQAHHSSAAAGRSPPATSTQSPALDDAQRAVVAALTGTAGCWWSREPPGPARPPPWLPPPRSWTPRPPRWWW